MKQWLGGLLVLALMAQLPLHAQEPVASSADLKFKAIYEKEWAWRKTQFPGMGDEGDSDSRVERLPRVDADSQRERRRVWEDVLAQLDQLPVAELSAAERINLAIYRPQVSDLADNVRFGSYEMPFNSDSSFWSDLGFITRKPMRKTEDVEAYLKLLADIPRYFDEQTANMRAGLKRGFSVPREVLAGRDVSIAAVADLTDAEKSEFFKPLVDLPSTIPVERQEQLRAQARSVIADEVIPAFSRLLAFFRDE